MKKISIFLCFAVIFASLFGGSVYAKDVEGFPTLPTISLEHDAEYFIFKNGNGNTQLLMVFSTNVTGERISKDYIISQNTDNIAKTLIVKSARSGSYRLYNLNNAGTSWSVNGSLVDFSGNQDITVTQNVGEIYYSDYDVHSITDGSLVFPGPLVAPTLEEIIQEEMTNLQTETVGTMKILAVCGVGCLALLIGFLLLPKILYRFL